MRPCCGGKRLLHLTFLQQCCKCGRCVLLAAVAVKSQATGIAAFPESGSECAGDQICTGIAGYSITDDFAGEEVENDTEIDPVVIDFEGCNIKYSKGTTARCTFAFIILKCYQFNKS